MLSAQRIRPEQWETLKTLRLAGLREAPHAFSATYESASQRTDAEWREMAHQRATSPDSCMYFVYEDDEPVGIAGGYRDAEQPGIVQLVSVWVTPEHRKIGAGQVVVEAVCAWATALPVPYLFAYVTATNARALRFYERIGFQPVVTGSVDVPGEHDGEVLLSCSLTP